MNRRSNQGFTLIEMMIALVAGLVAISSIYAVSGASNREFFEQQKLATTQGTTQLALEELRKEIIRAGLFGTPRIDLEKSCDPNPMTLPLLGTGTVPAGAFQYYANEDDSYVDPGGLNGTHADRLRILGNTLTNDRYSIETYFVDPSSNIYITLEQESQAFRRSFLYGYSTLSAFRTGVNPSLFNALAGGFKDSIIHIETLEGNHFLRYANSGPVLAGGILYGHLRLTSALPVNTPCIKGDLKGATLAPLQWLEHLVLDRNSDEVGENFMEFEGVWEVPDVTEAPLFPVPEVSELEDGNAILVQRKLDITTGEPTNAEQKKSTKIIAEWVVHFKVSFIIDTASGNPALSPNLILVNDDSTPTAEEAVNANPEQVRVVIVDLALRTPSEDPNLPFVNPGTVPTRYEVDTTSKGSARIRRGHIEIPIRNLAVRNLYDPT